MSVFGKAKVIRNRDLWLRLIGVFKLFKGVVLLVVGVGALRLLHKDMALEVERWANIFRVDPNNRYLYRLAARVANLDDKRLKELSIGTFFYAALFFTEGTGLLLLRRWAEYFTLIVTTSLLPIEVYEFTRRTTVPRAIVLLLNVGVVVYLAFEVRRRGARR